LSRRGVLLSIIILVGFALFLGPVRSALGQDPPDRRDIWELVIADTPHGYYDLNPNAYPMQAAQSFQQTALPLGSIQQCQDAVVYAATVGVSRCGEVEATEDLQASIRAELDGPDLATAKVFGGAVTSGDPMNPTWVTFEFDEPVVAWDDGPRQLYLVLNVVGRESPDYSGSWTPAELPDCENFNPYGYKYRWSIEHFDPYMDGDFIPSQPPYPLSYDALSKLHIRLSQSVDVMALFYDPIIEIRDRQRLSVYTAQYTGARTRRTTWGDPYYLNPAAEQFLERISSREVDIRMTTEVLDAWPPRTNGGTYTDETFVWDFEDPVNLRFGPGRDFAYQVMMDTVLPTQGVSLTDLVNAGDVDEVWVWTDPTAGMYEAVMAGPAAYNLNGGPIALNNLSRRVTIMGWTFERNLDWALHSYAHRVEGVMTHLGFSEWSHFTRLHRDHPGLGSVGTVHLPFNAPEDPPPPADPVDYAYYERTGQLTDEADWYNYPDFTGERDVKNCEEWNCYHPDYMEWWHDHIPNYAGTGNNWWPNIANPVCYP
jgi:hypothetical protein